MGSQVNHHRTPELRYLTGSDPPWAVVYFGEVEPTTLSQTVSVPHLSMTLVLVVRTLPAVRPQNFVSGVSP